MTSRQQRKHIEFITPYNEHFYHHIEDLRGPEEKAFQHEKMEWIFRRNLTLFGIEYTEKKKVKYQPSQRFRLDLGDGWYCNITDNQLKREHTILTVHGAPGDHKEWAGIQKQMDAKCRWVNVIVPGFDQQDERRGSYTGSAEHFAEMLVRIIHKLGLGKIIYCGHSLGSIYASYFIEKYPEYVIGYINVTGIVNTWYTGLLAFFYRTIAQWQFNNIQSRRQVFMMSEEERKIQHFKFLSATKQYWFGPAPFPELTLTEYFAYVKLFNTFPNGISQNYRKNKDHKLLRVLFFGRSDPIHIESLTDQSCYYFCFDPHSYTNSSEFRKLLKLAQSQLKQKMWLSYGVGDFKVEEIQQYFAYHFPDTGHNAHKRRPSEIGKILKVYLDCLSILAKYQALSQTKL